MKKISLIMLMLFSLMLSSFSLQAAEIIKADVNGMVCAFCAQGIEKKLRKLPQTQDVYVDLKNHIVAIELKDQQTLSTESVKALIKDAGYDVTGVKVIKGDLQQFKPAAPL
jgi:mercuric ion binding protein